MDGRLHSLTVLDILDVELTYRAPSFPNGVKVHQGDHECVNERCELRVLIESRRKQDISEQFNHHPSDSA